MEQQIAWRQAFVSGQEKLVVSERLLPRVHLIPHSIVNAEQPRSSAMVEAFVICLVWGENAVPADALEHAVFCVPLHAVGETTEIDAVSLPLYNNAGESMGDCNGAFVMGAPSLLSELREDVSAQSVAEILTFAEHPEGGLPRAAEAFALWSVPADLAQKCLVFLDPGNDALRALVQGAPLEDDVFLSAGEDERGELEGDQLRAWQLLIMEQAPGVVPPLAGSASKQPHRVPPPRRGGTSVAGSQNVAGLGPSSTMGRGALLGEQQAQGLVQRLREAKSKAAAKSQEVGELAAALLTGMQQLGDRLSRLEGGQALSASPLRSPPPAPKATTPLGMASARASVAKPIAPSQPPLKAGASPQFGGLIGGQLLERGLLTPKASAATRSYQTILQQAQQQLVSPLGGSAQVGVRDADLPPTRGRERGTGRVLRELLQQQQQGTDEQTTQLLMQASMLEALEALSGRGGREPETLEDLLLGTNRDEEDSSRLGSTARGNTNLTRWHLQIERHPDLFVELFNSQVIKALGADITGTPWSVQQYAATRINFRRLETHERAFYMMAALHSHAMRGEHSLVLAKTCQFMKSLEQSVQQNGAWKSAWLLTGLPDPRPGGYQQGLSHAAELGLTAAYLKELKLLEDASKKEGESAPPGAEPKRKPGGGKGDHTKGTQGSDGKGA
eukprot:6345207-Amphidinium_carterae.1